MGDVTAKQKLLSRLQPQNQDVWSITAYLANASEMERRRTLRPHAEAGFQLPRDRELIDQRRRLDAALGVLTLLEIGYELGIVTEMEVAEIATDPVPSRAHIEKLFESEAMLHYANAYSYFGLRFLAARITRPSWLVSTPEPRLKRSSNVRPFSLAIPPAALSAHNDARFRAFLDLPKGRNIRLAQSFLDDFIKDRNEPEELELWLRGLRPAEDTTTARRFFQLRQGMIAWALSRAQFYLRFDKDQARNRPVGGWRVTDPAAARFALADIYWITRLFRAEISANARVTYLRSNWLHLLRFHSVLRGETEVAERLRDAEEVLRSVFDFVCDLVQNAVELSDEKERKAYAPELAATLPELTIKWREVFDEELEEIAKQRDRRRFREAAPPDNTRPTDNYPTPGSPPGPSGKEPYDWRERIRTGKQPRNLIGLALSGGGVRSATFGLGVLKGLQELDLLRYVDCLSTVSGGGFIGSWLVGNVSRTAHWLGRLTNWEQSIEHLRKYSSYLSPKTGVLSSDTWTMWASWARNAFLIQLTGLAWLFTILLGVLSVQSLFRVLGGLPGFMWMFWLTAATAALMTAILLWTLLYNLSDGRALTGGEKPDSGPRVRLLAVLPAWIGAFLLASLFWADATGTSPVARYFEKKDSYSGIFLEAWWPWLPVIVVLLISLFLIAFRTLHQKQRWNSVWVSVLCVFVLYIEFCGILRVFFIWAVKHGRFDWYAFVLGPPMVLAANTITVVLFIGFCGRYTNESLREWWTRFGTWLFIYGAGYLFFTTAAVFGPPWIFRLASNHYIKWATVAGWVGTVLSGLLAGKSSKTSGDTQHSPALEWLAKAGGLLFIIGAVLGSSTLLYILLFNICPNCPASARYWDGLQHIHLSLKLLAFAVALICGSLFSWFFEINIFGLNQFYRNRLVRCYLGATRWAPGVRSPQPFTKFDGLDDMRLSNLRTDYRDAVAANGNEFRGPFPILNCALNLGGSSDLSLHTRHSASFSLTPLRCGADREQVGYAPTRLGSACFADGVMLGQAVSISGAAASPNMGYNTSPMVAYLLTMFNVRLGWWFPNPGRKKWNHPGLQFSLYYLTMELFGIADETANFVNVSDGGHFENLGIYELVRRRCKVIIAVDGECDEQLTFGSLGNVVRLCETDFGARIDIDVSSIRKQENGLSLSHCAVGTIVYSNGSIGYLIYLKASITGDEDIGVAQYRSAHPSFPHETTADQFFSEDQFESYRRLGQHVLRRSLRGTQPGDHPVAIAEKLADVLTPTGCSSEIFLKHTRALDRIWEHFRRSPRLHPFMNELVLSEITQPDPSDRDEEFSIGLELIQLMENAFLDLRLDDFWEHPDNRGWAILFMRWARSPRLREIWAKTRRTFGIRFEYFCAARLGLSRDEPIVRV